MTSELQSIYFDSFFDVIEFVRGIWPLWTIKTASQAYRAHRRVIFSKAIPILKATVI